MESLCADEDFVEDVLQKLKSGRQPPANIISKAEVLYAKLKTEIKLNKDEIIEIKKIKNAEVPKDVPVQEEPNNVEIYKLLEANARHTAENERLKEELTSAKSENEHLSKQLESLKEQIEIFEANACKEKDTHDVANESNDRLEVAHGKISDANEKENIPEIGVLEREKKFSVKEKDFNEKDNTVEVRNEKSVFYDKQNCFSDDNNYLRDHADVVLDTDDKNDTSNKDLQNRGADTHDWSKMLQDKEQELQDIGNSLNSLKEELNEQKEGNRRLQIKLTNLNQDLKLQQKITIDKERQIQTLEDDLNNLTDENNKLKSENARLKLEIGSLHHIRKEIEHKENTKDVHTVAVFGSGILEENRKLKSENEHLKGELQHANEKVHSHSKQINEMAVKRERSSHNGDYKSDIEALRLENKQLHYEVKKLSSKVENANHDRESHKSYEGSSYSNDQLPRLDGFNKDDSRGLQEENRRLMYNVKQLKQEIAYAKHDRDQQRKQEDIAHRKVLKYKEEIKILTQEKERLNQEKVSLERDLQRAKDKLELVHGERNKEIETRQASNYGVNGYSMNTEYRFKGGPNMKLESELQAAKDQLRRLLDERKRDQQKESSYREDYSSLKKDFDKMQHAKFKLERDLKIAQASLQHVQEERDRLKLSPAKSIEEEYSDHLGKERMYRMKRGLGSESRATRESLRKLSESSYDMKENDDERKRIEDFRRTIERQKEQIKMLSHENKTLQNDVHEVRNRLSVLAGHKLTADNPNIADLSDSYRPTNIAEQFHEVYDNEWTQAYEELESIYRHDEAKIIDSLVTILKNVEVFCQEAASHQFISLKTAIENELTYPKYKLENGTVMAGKHRAEMSSSQKDIEDKFLKDLRKSLGILSTGPLAQIFNEVFVTKELGVRVASAGLKAFVAQSVKLVWMMKMQTPPMELLWVEPKQSVDRDRFTFYTKRGDVIKFCVWPALELHKNGPLVSKGIVQAK